jgi:2-methylisocitrate lyase-like PEP mutase family enzyme
LQAYQEAGADVLYAPGLTREADIRALVSSVDRPVNVVMGLATAPFSVAQLAAMGVRRISIGSALARRAYSALIDAAREMREDGTFGFAQDATSHARFTELFAR